ncbi:MAG: WYL domain-containing protein [Candidatus Pristimantibacillus sp.]
MNLFEKIFNYQVMSRLDEAGSIALTSQERGWLRALLEHSSSSDAFTSGTLEKLGSILLAESPPAIRNVIIEKARNKEKQVYHPLLRSLRRIIIRNQGITLISRMKHGGTKTSHSAMPYKLEYSMVKREWYLLWYNTRYHNLMSTKLQNIISMEETPLPAAQVERWQIKLASLLANRQDQTVIEVVSTYNTELSRILYAFSCFEKSVAYEDATDTYRIHVTYFKDEGQYLLSKIRFLGKRVRIVEGDTLKYRMQESTSKALARYGVGND